MKFFTISSVQMLTLALTLGTSSVVNAQSPNSSRHERGCSNRTLLGDYGAKIEGTLLGPNWAVRTLVLFRFDGHGNVTSFGHPVVNGAPPAEEWAETAGTYTVNPDCTGTISVEIFASGTEILAVTLSIAFDEDMKHMRGIFTSAATPNGTQLPTVINLDARKQ